MLDDDRALLDKWITWDNVPNDIYAAWQRLNKELVEGQKPPTNSPIMQCQSPLHKLADPLCKSFNALKL
jgi:hypothetical protein